MRASQKGFTFIYILLLIIIILVGIGAYYFGTRNAPGASLSPVPNTALPSPVSSPSPSPLPSPSPSPASNVAVPSPALTLSPMLLENIKASVVSKNTGALEGYMTDTVNVIIEATECCGNLSKVKAIGEMDYLNSATEPWNFDDNNPIALQLKQINHQTFPDGIIIGTSANRRVVTFTLNKDKTKIEKLYMAVDYKLFGI